MTEALTGYNQTEGTTFNPFNQPPGGIHAAIAKVYEKVAYVQKSRTLSTGQGGGYKFAGEAGWRDPYIRVDGVQE